MIRRNRMGFPFVQLVWKAGRGRLGSAPGLS
jgi:hypothetical protein